MTRCEYCGGEIDVNSRKCIWIDKESDFALHKKCSKEFDKKLPEMIKEMEIWLQKIRQPEFAKLSDSEELKMFEDMNKSCWCLGHGSANITKERKIQVQEDFIEMLKKIDLPGTEQLLKEAIEDLKRLKDKVGT